MKQSHSICVPWDLHQKSTNACTLGTHCIFHSRFVLYAGLFKHNLMIFHIFFHFSQIHVTDVHCLEIKPQIPGSVKREYRQVHFVILLSYSNPPSSLSLHYGRERERERERERARERQREMMRTRCSCLGTSL